MSQQYYYNTNTQYTTPTTYAAQAVSACYTGAVAQPLTSGYSTTRVTAGSGYNVSSAHRSSAPVTYTYPTNATVVAPPVAVVPAQQATIVASPHPSGKVPPGASFVIANGPTSATPNLTNNGAYTVTTSYFQQIPGQTPMQTHNMAQAAAVAAAHHAAVAAASARGRRKPYTGRGIDNQMFYCDVCKISCAGPQTYKEHLDGQKHKKKAAGSKIPMNTVTKSNQRQLRCELCDVTCTGVDAYQAHIRGTKHQKTFKLHQKLGKPIPCADPIVVKPATTSGTDPSADMSNVVITAAPKINFIAAQQQQVTTDISTDLSSKVTEEHVDLNSLQEKSVIPVGAEYIETTKNENGKIIQFYCKLCSCKFNDPHAKEMHLKGRRHRLQYKKKVDPSLVVDVKTGNNSRSWKVQEDKMRQKQQREEFWRRRDMQVRMREMQRLEYSNMPAPPLAYGMGGQQSMGGRGSFDTLDDRHVMTKHSTIFPTDDELQTVQTVVTACEKALRQISEILLLDDDDDDNTNSAIKKEADVAVEEDSNKETTETKSSSNNKESEKALCGAMRIGSLAKGLLLRGDLVVSMVLLCSKWPTYSLMTRVIERLPEKLKEIVPNEKLEVTLNEEEDCILVTRKKEPEMECYVKLTSSVVREESADGTAAVQPEDGLDRKRCLEALASLRHTKWFQAKVSNLQPCLVLIRILRDLCQRVPTWNPVSSWMLELLVEKVVSSDPMKLSPGGALRRFFECMASGILLPGGPGLRDPCEKDLCDASSSLSDQDREDIVASAQHALRLIAFRQIHRVLDMDQISSSSAMNAANDQYQNARKRRHSDEEELSSSSAAHQKKDKKEKEGEKELLAVESIGIECKSSPQ